MDSSIELTVKNKNLFALIVLLAMVPVSALQAQGRGFDTSTLRLPSKADNLYRSGQVLTVHGRLYVPAR